MYNNQEYMHQLIVGRLTGMISREDENYLEQSIRQDVQVQWLWEEMRDKWAKLQGGDKMRLLNPARELATIKQKLGSNKRKNYVTVQRIATTAVVFCYALCRKLIDFK